MSNNTKKIPFDQFFAYDISKKDFFSKENLEEIITNTKIDYIISSLYINSSYTDSKKILLPESTLTSNTWSNYFSSSINLSSNEKDFEEQVNYSIYLGVKYVFLENFSFQSLLEKQHFLISTMKSNQSFRIVFNLLLSNSNQLISSIEVINNMLSSKVIDRIAYSIVVDSEYINTFLLYGIPIWSHIIQESICYNIRFLSIDSRLFIKNEDDSIYLTEELNEIIKFYIKYEIDIILLDNQPSSSINSIKKQTNLSNNSILMIENPSLFNKILFYFQFLFETHSEYSSNDLFVYKYKDILQLPLQPLKDNLSSKTYETFELDSIKYEKYGEAIYYSIKDIIQKENSEEQVNSQSFPIKIAILGAGRGGLIHQTIQAARINSAYINITAYEKNEYAYINLRIKYETYINQGILVVKHEDVRYLHLKYNENEKYDIVVSELLGSFGDNELSPECLENINVILKPNAVLIPQRYSSYLTPVNFQLTYCSIYSNKEISHETPLVCLPYRYYSCFSIEKCFEFSHFYEENKKKFDFHIYKKQVKSLSFKRLFKKTNSKEVNSFGLLSTYIYGFIGYFDCTLYKNISISTHPYTKTPNMNSWFPIYFPIQSRIHLTYNQSLCLSIERHNNLKSVWYSWVVYIEENEENEKNEKSYSGDSISKRVVYVSNIHNLNGEASKMEL